MRTLIVFIACLLCFAYQSQAVTVTVPGDYTTIQGAINAVPGNGDTILVSPNTYVENINFFGKAILVRSDVDGNEATLDFDPFNTVIDGNQSGSVAIFAAGEGETSILQGFKLTNGSGTLMGSSRYGGGIFCAYDAQPMIRHCVICDNQGAIDEDINELIDLGGGVFSGFGLSSDPEQWTHPKLINCVIFRNQAFGSNYGHGGGIACWHKAKVTMVNCTLYGNEANADFGQGGGLWCLDQTEAHVANTIVYINRAAEATQIWVGNSSFPSTVVIEYSFLDGNDTLDYVETNCIYDKSNHMQSGDPKLKDPSNLDFGLTTDSNKCISKGLTSFIETYQLERDINNLDRTIVGIDSSDNIDVGTEDVVDIGADEYQPFYVPQIFGTIAAAVADAPTNLSQIIAIAPGTYYEHLNLGSKPVTLRSDADGKVSTKKDQVPEQTFLDGSQNGRVVMFEGGSNNTGVLDGFTITNGSATRGAGVYCSSDSDAQIIGCIIKNNHASEYGGGICVASGAAVLMKTVNGKTSTFENNTAGIGGGGVYVYEVQNNESDIRDCIFVNNSAGAQGGAIGSTNAWMTIKNNIIHDNTAPRGGGIYMFGQGDNDSNIFLNTIYDNGASIPFDIQAGGGVCIEGDCYTRLHRNLIYGNNAIRGGGVYCDGSKPTLLTTNSIAINTADYGGGLYYSASARSPDSNTLYANHANFEGGGYYLIDCDPDVEIGDNLLWQNTAPVGAAIQFANVLHNVVYCDVTNGPSYSWFDETNSIALDPLWENQSNPQGADYLHLSKNSPVINMGLNAYAVNKDIDEANRPVAGRVDIGSDEYTKTLELLGGQDGTALPDNGYNIYVYPEIYFPLEFYLDASSDNAGRDYFLLASLTGTAPGLKGLPGGEFLPLVWDYMTDLTVAAAIYGSPIFQDFGGQLDADGKATAIMNYQGLLDESMIGIDIYFAFILKGGGKPSWNFASNPITISIKKSDA